MGYETTPADIELVPKIEINTLENIVETEDDHPHDECGVYAIYAPGQPILSTIYNALYKLRHRGQSGAGIAYFDKTLDRLDSYTGVGKLHEAIPDAKPDPDGQSFFDLSESSVAVGHVRYSTADSDRAAQPVVHDFALAHNGHIEDIHLLAKKYDVDTTDEPTDSHALTALLSQQKQELGSLDAALAEVLPKVEGAFSLTITDGERILGVRDPWGFRPLVLGELPYEQGSYVLASEESALQASGAEFVRDIEAGEIVSIDADGVRSTRIDRSEENKECMYEYIYFARPWETVNGVDVYSARHKMGQYLYEDHPVEGADMVVAVPNSGRSAAAGYARHAGLPNEEGIFVEEGAGRTFILREGMREELLDDKHIPNRTMLEGKSIVLVDDSVIKGSTMTKLIKKLRTEGGVREIHVRSASPPYVSACYAGMDTRDIRRLVAKGRANEEIARIIDADSIAFNSVFRVHQAINEARTKPATTICDSCATGEYPFRQHTFAKKVGNLALVPDAEDEDSRALKVVKVA